MCFLITDQCNRNDLSLFHLHYMLIFPQPRWNNKRSPRQRSWATIHQKCCKNHSPGSGHLSGNAAPPIPPRSPSPDKKRHAPQGLIKEHALLSYCFYSYHQHSTYSVNNCLWSPCDDCQNSTIYYTKSLLSCQCSVSFLLLFVKYILSSFNANSRDVLILTLPILIALREGLV